jgi:hypothetical protein
MDYTSKAKNITSNSNSDFAMLMKNSYKRVEQLKSNVKATSALKGTNKKAAT